ncbi:MAG: SEC-C domain-containing protein [Cryomorphaceae bacterium]|nr:SEC-C domain-containing protein [Cryomorphaceae bacterium]
MKGKIKSLFDLSKPRRRYFSIECGLKSCPECDLPLVKEVCTVHITAKSDTDEVEFMSNLTNSHFCPSCPVVVLDSDKIEKAVRLGIRGDKNLKYLVTGIIDFNAIPINKRHLEIGTDYNPMPLVRFLPDLNATKISPKIKVGRNEPCICGSGKKYKKCCG